MSGCVHQVAVHEQCSKTVWDRFVLAYTSGVLRVFCSDGFPYVIAPAFSIPAFSSPAIYSCIFHSRIFSAPFPTQLSKQEFAMYGVINRNEIESYEFITLQTVMQVLERFSPPRSKVMPVSDFYSPHHRIWHQFCNIWRVVLMTLNQHSSRSSKVQVHAASRKPIGGFLYNLHCVQHCISHGIRDIWCESSVA